MMWSVELHDMIDYYIGVLHGFEFPRAKRKYFRKYRSDIYERYAATYSGNNYKKYMSIDTMCDLFHTLAAAVAEHFGFTTGRRKKTG